VIFRAVGFEQIDPVSPAKSPKPPRARQVNATTERHWHKASAKFQSFRVHLTIWITDEPCLMPISIQPINFETRAILLAAPAAAALYVENVHVESATTAVTPT
jgi:hypothetical protein